ncbi:hypothetical protein [Wenyingzhuangia aestuarii]|uniref:hypothetical protein n=1 Tax=Wenyingzhuangia aestuarii TaxID=1647582 RepID=UPI001438F4A1|nr:hypothetical protein [Wenyingzhuangia aestuarii]NJB82481.1 hypothetical protein [Wenyingzhuangia aestuarii]
MKKIIYLLSPLLFICINSYAQTEKDLEDDFLNYQKSEEQKFKKYKDDRDKEFASFLKQDWKIIKTTKGHKASYAKPKPTILPKVAKTKPLNIPAQKIGIIKTEIKKVPISKRNIPSPKPIKEEKKHPVSEITVDFYNTKFLFTYDQKFIVYLDRYDEKSIAKYWELLSTTQYYSFLTQTLNIKKTHHLNDWAYYVLLRKISEKLYKKTALNEQNLFIWYLLSKAGYQCNVARINNNSIALLAPFKNTVYNKPSVTINNKNFYIITPYQQGDKVYTYKNKYPDTHLVLDLNIYQPILLGTATTEKQLKFKNGTKMELVNVSYNPNNMLFYQDILHSDFSLYFGASVNKTTEETLLKQLKLIIKDQNIDKALNTLLHFVQLSFEYKTDGEQFGYEKYFFVEELFHYQYSDCEDRSILFSYLTKKLLNLEVIGLEFPGHLATAVLVNQNIKGDYILYKDKRYLVCDPTYINADIGMTMPQYKNSKITVIEL